MCVWHGLTTQLRFLPSICLRPAVLKHVKAAMSNGALLGLTGNASCYVHVPTSLEKLKTTK
jgi:hypothetical protein